MIKEWETVFTIHNSIARLGFWVDRFSKVAYQSPCVLAQILTVFSVPLCLCASVVGEPALIQQFNC